MSPGAIRIRRKKHSPIPLLDRSQFASDCDLLGRAVAIGAICTRSLVLEERVALVAPLAPGRPRRELFDAIQVTQVADLAPDRAVVALADFSLLTEEIDRYVRAWSAALEQASSSAEIRALLSVDTVVVRGLSSDAEVALVGPTHPLRIAWFERLATATSLWLQAQPSETEQSDLRAVFDELHPANVPHLIPGDRGPLRPIEHLDARWGVWAGLQLGDPAAMTARLRSWIGVSGTAIRTVHAGHVVSRVHRYIAAHPYVETLILNFVQPGAGDLALDLLLNLQADSQTENLRYVVRLFGDDFDTGRLGATIDQFMTDPESIRSIRRNEADAFISAGNDVLAPKLRYSKHPVDALVASPEEFPAHLTVFLDWFELAAGTEAPESGRRSVFGAGLLVDPSIKFSPGDTWANPAWSEQVASPDATDTFEVALQRSQTATARLIGGSETTRVPALRLELDRVDRAILDAVHRASDWVVIIDPVFTDEFLDTPSDDEGQARYLIDYVESRSPTGGRHVVVSTRLRRETHSMLQPVARERFGLDLSEAQIRTLVDGLQALGSGLVLRLLQTKNQAAEALSLALTAAYLGSQGILRHALVIPIDLYPDLVREAQAVDESVTTGRRADLAVVQLIPERRVVGVHLIEVKVRSNLPSVLPTDLVSDILEQLENSRRVLRSRLFGAELRRDRGSLAGAVAYRRLYRLLTRHLERSRRYGLLPQAEVEELMRFVASLDHEFSLGFTEHALVFEPTRAVDAVEEHENVEFRRIGLEGIRESIAVSGEGKFGTVYVDEDNAEFLRSVMESSGGKTIEELVGTDSIEQASPPESEPASEADDRPVEPVEGPDPSGVVVLGIGQGSVQYGVIGRHPGLGKFVALDTDGTNVISVFGVQGSGKSYTVGNVLEAALIADPKVNRLRKPLAGIVFHYSRDQSYEPEFLTMDQPNADDDLVAELHDVYGADPRAVDSLCVLVPEGVLEQRRRELPGVQVEPLLLGTKDLQLSDWKLVMGLDSSDAMYARQINQIFRELRDRVSIEALKEKVESSKLNSSQKNLASMRLSFVEPYLRADGSVTEYVKPGQLTVVDLRDELVEEEEALSLFMVLLNRFSQVTAPDGSDFNKVIVFDEAHKYMSNPRLTGAIVETIREMRHKGTSVVIASQDPPSVPKEVIELSTVIVVHKFTSPNWLKHIAKVNTAFEGNTLKASQLIQLPPGEAYVWSANERFKRPQRIEIRPRLSRHGGATKRAND